MIKVPGSFSGRAERERLWNVGIPNTQLPWPGAHKLSKPPRQCNRPSVTSHARVLKQTAGTPSILQTCCFRELSKVSKAILAFCGTHPTWTIAMIPEQYENHRHTQSQTHTVHHGLPGAKCISGEVSFSSVELGKKTVSALIPH